MSWSAPTHITYTQLTYEECAEAYEQWVGVDPGASSGNEGQRIVEAMHCAWWAFQEELQLQGWSYDQIAEWLSVAGKATYAARARKAFLHGLVPSDSAAWQIIKELERKYERIKKGAGVLLGNDGAAMSRDTSSAASEDLQAKESYRNNTAGACHAFDYDHSPRQFMGNSAVLGALGSRYGNGRLGRRQT